MSWQTWKPGITPTDMQRLSDMIFALMCEVAYELEAPNLNEWFDAGIQIGDGTGDFESVLVYHELEESDIDGIMVPGYTLTLQEADGQQETDTFFPDGNEQWWHELSDNFAQMIVEQLKYCGFMPRQ